VERVPAGGVSAAGTACVFLTLISFSHVMIIYRFAISS